MSRFSEEQLDKARRRWDVIAAEVKLRRAGRELVGLCPWHQEKSPSYYVVPDKGFAHCFGCGWSGTPIDHIMQRRGIGFLEAVAVLLDMPPQRASAPLPTPLPATDDRTAEKEERIADILAGCGPIEAGTAANMYLSMRGLSRHQPALLAHPGLQYTEDDKGPCDPSLTWRRWYSDRLRCWRRGSVLPALIAPSTDSRGRVTAIQRVWLIDTVIYDGTSPAPTDNRAPVSRRKQALGNYGDGAVRLKPADDRLGLAEGVETAIAASDRHNFPVWAICGLTRLGFPEHYRQRIVPNGEQPDIWIAPALPPRDVDTVRVPARPPSVWIPPGVKRLVIFGDNGIGEIVADHAARFYSYRFEIDATAMLPPADYGDFNDLTLAELAR